MDNLADILAGRHVDEPAEIKIIKQFMQDTFQVTVAVTVQPRQIIIGVNSAALAGALRMRLHELQVLCDTTKRLVIRIQ